MERFEVIRVSGIVTGVGIVEKLKEGTHSEDICQTLYDTGDNEKDAKESEIWATLICNLLNEHG